MQYAISRFRRKIIANWNGDIASSGWRSAKSATNGMMSGTATKMALNPSINMPSTKRKTFITSKSCQRCSIPILSMKARTSLGMS